MDLRLATFNVQNLDDQAQATRITRLARTIVEPLASPHLLALQEVGGTPGTEPGLPAPPCTAAYRLVERIAELGGPRYQMLQVSPLAGHDGGQAGTDIRPVILYDSSILSFRSRGNAGPGDPTQAVSGPRGAELSLNPGRVHPTHPVFQGDPDQAWRPSRKALAAQFTHRGRSLLFLACHLTSMRGETRRGVENARRQRHAQARVIADFVKTVRDADPNAWVFVLGDFNDTPGTKTLELLRMDWLVNPITELPKRTRYTRRHAGKPQALDHILIPPDLADRARIDITHVNSDTDPAIRASDHDPVLVTLALPPGRG